MYKYLSLSVQNELIQQCEIEIIRETIPQPCYIKSLNVSVLWQMKQHSPNSFYPKHIYSIEMGTMLSKQKNREVIHCMCL